jgi:hypothetical protein
VAYLQLALLCGGAVLFYWLLAHFLRAVLVRPPEPPLSDPVLQAALAALPSAVDAFDRTVVQTYPHIPWAIWTQQQHVDALQTAAATASRRRTSTEMVESALRAAVPTLDGQFKLFRWEDKPVPRERSDEELWPGEARHRVTVGGGDPPDWRRRKEWALERAGFACERCGLALSSGGSHLHHMRLRSQGGHHDLSNLVVLCRDCHTLMPEHAGLAAIRPYMVSEGGVIHVPRRPCAQGEVGMASFDRLVRHGATPCPSCHPEVTHDALLARKRPQFTVWLGDLAAFCAVQACSPSSGADAAKSMPYYPTDAPTAAERKPKKEARQRRPPIGHSKRWRERVRKRLAAEAEYDAWVQRVNDAGEAARKHPATAETSLLIRLYEQHKRWAEEHPGEPFPSRNPYEQPSHATRRPSEPEVSSSLVPQEAYSDDWEGEPPF